MSAFSIQLTKCYLSSVCALCHITCLAYVPMVNKRESNLPLGVPEPGGETNKEQGLSRVRTAAEAEGDPPEVASPPGLVCGDRIGFPERKWLRAQRMTKTLPGKQVGGGHHRYRERCKKTR